VTKVTGRKGGNTGGGKSNMTIPLSHCLFDREVEKIRKWVAPDVPSAVISSVRFPTYSL